MLLEKRRWNMSATVTCRNIDELLPVAQKACRLFLAECKKEGLNVCITETYRSQDRQNYLYEQGRSRAGNVVTWTKNSRHTGRMAWDICKNVKGQEYSDAAFFKKCGAVAKRLGITWGGEWKTPDMPHFEVDKNWKYEGDEVEIAKDTIIVGNKEYTVDMIRQDGLTFIKARDIANACGFDVSNKGRIPVFTK